MQCVCLFLLSLTLLLGHSYGMAQPVPIELVLSANELTVGDQLNATCNTSSETAPVDLEINGSPIINIAAGRFIFTIDGTLSKWTINPVQVEDAGTYVCVAAANSPTDADSLPQILTVYRCNGSYSAAATSDGVNWNVDWYVSADFYSIVFTVTAKTEGWVAIGFSRDQAMPNTDIIVGAADGAGNSYVSDRFATAQSAPPVDASQDIFEYDAQQMVTSEGTYTIVSFARPICSTDQYDYSLDEDLYILYAWGNERNFDGSDAMSIMQHATGAANRGFSASRISFVCGACHSCYSAAGTIPGVRWNAGWSVSADSQYVSFAVAALTDGWVAIGFSMNQMMPATDIIVGAVDDTGTSSYVSDRYASMRAAPDVDAEQDIMNSNAVQIDIGRNNWTVVTFTRPVSADSADDLDLNVPVFFLYAWGTENNFDPTDSMSINQHGSGVANRGFSAMPITVLCPACSGHYSAAATSDGVNWTVYWYLSADSSYIVFTVMAKTEGWVAIGFSRDQAMPNTDIIVGAADGAGNSYVSDRFATARDTPPVDDSQDIFQTNAQQIVTSEGNYTIVIFARPICSTDQYDFSLKEDLYILYAWGNERNFNGSDAMSIMQHGTGAANRGFSASPISFVCGGCGSLLLQLACKAIDRTNSTAVLPRPCLKYF